MTSADRTGDECDDGRARVDTGDDVDRGADAGADADAGDDAEADAGAADRFVVGIHRTETALEVVVRVPSDLAAGWRNPTSFQQLVEQRTWERLDQAATLRAIAADADPGETVTLGTITLRPDGTVVDHTLTPPFGDDNDDGNSDGD